MRWRLFLIISACVNAVLIAAVWHYARRSPAPESALTAGTNTPAPYRTQVVVRRQYFTWGEVESPDYHTYVANLRDIGCPEQTIRDIIVADVNAFYAKRAATEVRTPDQQWWRSSPDSKLGAEAESKLRALDKERRELLASLLGPEWSPQEALTSSYRTSSVTLDGPVLGQLPADTKQSINSVVVASQTRMEELLAKARAEGRNPTSAELAALREQTRAELQKILPPAQLEEFLLRYSQNAVELRSELGNLRYFNATPEEFRALFRARDQFDQKLAALADSTDPNDIRQRQSLEAQREQAIKLALGEKRYQLYSRLQDPAYQTAYAQATAAGTPGAAQTVYAVNQATAQEMADTVRSSSNLTDEQMAIAMKRLELEQAQATALAVGQDIPPDPNAPPPPPPPPEPRIHVIRPGDTLGALSTAYGLPVNAIMEANPDLQINALKSGQQITIPPAAR